MGVDPARRARIEDNLRQWGRAGAQDGVTLVTDGLTELAAVPGLMTEVDAHLLAGLARSAAPAKALEVGRFCGYSTALLARCGLRVTSIDSNLTRAELARLAPWHVPVLDQYQPGWQSLLDCAQRTLASLAPAVTLLVGNSHDATSWPQARDFALAFVDGGHDEQTALNDLRQAWPRLRPGGVLAVHDYELVLRVDPASGVDLAVARWMEEATGGFNGPFAWPGSSIVWVRKAGG